MLLCKTPGKRIHFGVLLEAFQPFLVSFNHALDSWPLCFKALEAGVLEQADLLTAWKQKSQEQKTEGKESVRKRVDHSSCPLAKHTHTPFLFDLVIVKSETFPFVEIPQTLTSQTGETMYNTLSSLEEGSYENKNE